MTLPRPTGLVLTLIFKGALHVAGRASVGPQSVFRDRFDYSGEVARSCKVQALRNILFFINHAHGLVVLSTITATGARACQSLVTIPAGWGAVVN